MGSRQRKKDGNTFLVFCFCQHVNFCSWYVWPSAHPQSFSLSPNPGLYHQPRFPGTNRRSIVCKHTKRGLTNLENISEVCLSLLSTTDSACISKVFVCPWARDFPTGCHGLSLYKNSGRSGSSRLRLHCGSPRRGA